MNIVLIGSLVLMEFLFLVQTCFAGDDSRDKREISTASTVLLAAVIDAHLDSSTRAKKSSDLYDFKASAPELALALIASKPSRIGNNAFVSLIRYRLDGSLSEDFSCYALNKGKIFIKVLKDSKTQELVETCKGEVDHFFYGREGRIGIKDKYAVCSTEQEINRKIASLKQAINSSRKCDPEDF